MITIDINGEEYIQELNLLINRLEKLPRPLWEDIGKVLIDSVRNTFLAEGRPTAWQASQRVKRWGGSTLMQSGRLMYSGRISEITDSSVDVVHGEGIVYAFIHQYSGWAGRNHKSFIPARPYSIIQDADETEINQMVMDYCTTGEWTKK